MNHPARRDDFSDTPLFSKKPRAPSGPVPELPRVMTTESLALAQEWLLHQLGKTKDRGAVCPCCGQYAKVYKRKLNATMAAALVKMYRRTQKGATWIHPLKHLGLLICGGDYGKLVHWGLIEAQDQGREDGNPSSGFFRVTDHGKAFAQHLVRVPKHVYIYNNRLLGMDAKETIGVIEALGNKFNYTELMTA